MLRRNWKLAICHRDVVWALIAYVYITSGRVITDSTRILESSEGVDQLISCGIYNGDGIAIVTGIWNTATALRYSILSSVFSINELEPLIDLF